MPLVKITTIMMRKDMYQIVLHRRKYKHFFEQGVVGLRH